MTVAWTRVIHVMLREYGAAETAEAFFAAQPQLCEKKILRLFYSRALFTSPAAKVSFVEPDLAPLPK
jgi:hypothetical protein